MTSAQNEALMALNEDLMRSSNPVVNVIHPPTFGHPVAVHAAWPGLTVTFVILANGRVH